MGVIKKMGCLLLLCTLLFTKKGSAQCNLPISTFPYTEGFEANNGNWVINGTAPDWAWGAPTKPVITAAANGNKCWVTGGIATGFYTNAQSSWLQSPCFDFSALQFPYISFNIWWETERGFDGANLQYSLDNGISWTNVGAYSEPENCLNSNWYNSQSVRFLAAFGSYPEGWCGSVQSGSCASSNGSGGWVKAAHVLPDLAGQTGVLFRFTFGSGTQCNAFDGFAVDDILIQNAPSNNGSIGYTCRDSNIVDFSFNGALCAVSGNWDFGDIASGNNNTSSSPNPSHKFSAPGNYTVTITVNGAGNAPFIDTVSITILGLTTQITTPLTCTSGNIGEIKATVTGGTGPYDFTWNTQPIQTTATAINLPAGVYTITVTKAETCPIAATVPLLAPTILVKDTVDQPGCFYTKGAIRLSVIEGTAPFNYQWVPAVSAGSMATNLNNGNYIITITDNRNCVFVKTITIATLIKPSIAFFDVKEVNCDGSQLGSAAANIIGGTAPYFYQWNTDPEQQTNTAIQLKEGNFTLQVTDSNGCTAAATVNIGVSGFCNDVYFPSSFTPNNDLVNNYFGPLGNVVEISGYSITIYNRYGQIVFASNNPLEKWNGTYKGKLLPIGAYAWRTTYLYKQKNKRSQYGTLLLIR